VNAGGEGGAGGPHCGEGGVRVYVCVSESGCVCV